MLAIYQIFGLIFQLQDDIIDLYGNKGRQRVGCDIEEGKISFLIAMHMRFYPEDGDQVRQILQKSRDETDIFDIQWMKERFATKGTLQRCLDHLVLKLHEGQRKIQSLGNPGFQALLEGSFQDILKPICHLDDRFSNIQEVFPG